MSDPGVIQTQTAQAPAGKQAYTPPTLESLKRKLDDSRTSMQESRRQSGIDRDYYDGHQLTADEIAVLRARKQPQLVINRVRRGVDGVLGIAEQNRTDPRAYLRNPPDPGTQGPVQTQGQPMPGQAGPQQPPKLDAGDVATMALRFISDVNHFKGTKQDVLETGLVEGDGAAIVEAVDGDVTITHIRWEEYFYDPRSRRPDFADKRYDGIAKWMYADQVAAIYPEKAADINAVADWQGGLNAFDPSWQDRPQNVTAWTDRRQKRVVVVEMYYLEGTTWYRCVFWANGFLEEPAPSPYKDDKNRPINPIEAWSCYVDRENQRYGIVRDMRGPQDEINMRRSKLLHMLNSRQIQPGDLNAVPVDADAARQEAARPDGVIPPGWQLVPYSANLQGQVDLLNEAKTEIERLGPSPAILGRQGADASGRAVQLRQQAGMTEFARILGRFTDWELRIYKQCWWRAQQFWTDPKWIRVTNDEGAPQYVRLNEPVGAHPVRDPQTGQVQLVPKFNNHIAQMDVDIIVDTVPDTATLQQEIYGDLMDLMKVYGPNSVPFTVAIELSNLPRKREVIDKIEAAQAQQAQANAPAIQAKMAQSQAELAETQSITAKNQAQANLYEVQTVTAAMQGHVQASSAAQLPPGYTLGPNGQHIPLQAPPPGVTGAPQTASAIG